MQRDLTQGPIRRGLILFSLPLIAGNLLQQLYNIVDTWVVGRFLGNVALAAVGSAFSLMVLLTSLLLGLCIWLLRGMRLSGMAAAGVSLMAGGALGNLIDRAALGYVRDLFELLFVKFYIFNIADVGVVAGAVLCGVSLLWRPQDWSRRC